MPDTRPPPPTGTTIVSTSGTASSISKPTVPCPAMILASSNAGTNVAPVSAARASAVVSALGEVGAREHHFGLVHLGAVIFVNGVSAGITIVAGIPSRWAW